MNSTAYFKAPWGWPLRVISALGTLLLGGVAVAGCLRPGMTETMRLLVVGVPLLILALAALWTVRGYELGGGALAIQRGFWRTRVSLAGLLSAGADAQALRSSLRLFGNGGLFSFSGLFWNRRLGRFRIFATDPAQAVVLRFEHRTIVVTPDRPGDFVTALRGTSTAA